ncbi:hypothetical protein ACHAXS_012613 [Conticribra weissflogii]
MRKTIINLLARKLITIPRLSPSHSSARIVKKLVASGAHVIEYEPVLNLQCSPDLIADPADRVSENHRPIMLLESLEEGTLHWKPEVLEDFGEEKWYDVGTVLGEIVEDDNNEFDEGNDEEWTWQAYLHEDAEDSI